jgi:RimJ/RimL family protein N-acetyltransferase
MEWKLEIEMDPLVTDQELWENLISHTAAYISDHGGNRLVVILDRRKNTKEIEEPLRACGFDTYFVMRHSQLDLTTFDQQPPSLDEISIHRWSELHSIDHKDPGYLSSLRELYQVEYNADYEVRDTGRWDQFNPDPEEFVKRFTSGEASDEMMFVACAGERIVGLTYVWVENNEEAGIFFTGTVPEYTRKHIATALKISLANHLKAKGFQTLVTNNRANNVGILRTNEKLGFADTYQRLFLKLETET